MINKIQILISYIILLQNTNSIRIQGCVNTDCQFCFNLESLNNANTFCAEANNYLGVNEQSECTFFTKTYNYVDAQKNIVGDVVNIFSFVENNA